VFGLSNSRTKESIALPYAWVIMSCNTLNCSKRRKRNKRHDHVVFCHSAKSSSMNQTVLSKFISRIFCEIQCNVFLNGTSCSKRRFTASQQKTNSHRHVIKTAEPVAAKFSAHKFHWRRFLLCEREPITGVWRQSPQRGPGAEPLVTGSGRQSLPEAERKLIF